MIFLSFFSVVFSILNFNPLIIDSQEPKYPDPKQSLSTSLQKNLETDLFSFNFDPFAITNDRLADPSGYDTYVLDEAIVIFENDMTLVKVDALLATLPFEATVIESIVGESMFRVHLPGTQTPEVLNEKLDQLNANENISFAGRHNVGRAIFQF